MNGSVNLNNRTQWWCGQLRNEAARNTCQCQPFPTIEHLLLAHPCILNFTVEEE